MPRPVAYPPGFSIGGACPGPLDDKAVQRGEPPVVGYAGTPGSFANRRRTAFHAAPGISRVSPNRPGTGPSSPATQTGVSDDGTE